MQVKVAERQLGSYKVEEDKQTLPSKKLPPSDSSLGQSELLGEALDARRAQGLNEQGHSPPVWG